MEQISVNNTVNECFSEFRMDLMITMSTVRDHRERQYDSIWIWCGAEADSPPQRKERDDHNDDEFDQLLSVEETSTTQHSTAQQKRRIDYTTCVLNNMCVYANHSNTSNLLHCSTLFYCASNHWIKMCNLHHWYCRRSRLLSSLVTHICCK